MGSKNPAHLVSTAANLMLEHDVGKLEDKMIAMLCNELGMDSACILVEADEKPAKLLKIEKSFGIKDIQTFLPVITNEWGKKFVEISDSFSECIASKKELTAVSALDSSAYYAWFVLSGDNLNGLLVVSDPSKNDINRTIINSFVTIYTNYLAVINSGQRDTLTGLLNRKTFDYRIDNILSEIVDDLTNEPNERRKKNTDKHYWLGVLDIDHFKKVNDDFGHLYGDEVLLLFSKLMKKTFRSNDVLFRYGGEEFVVVLARSTEQNALMAFNRFRETIEQCSFPQIGQITVSIGIVELLDQHPALIFEHADKTLYYAKENGRNQVCQYNDLIARGMLKESEADTDVEYF
ncbi:MAG: GGDEF domain-containing protein [Gammaproteobacteria bacterium]|nr:GGDEF domain-containing protein [Gammaproteobacteria bacterium]